MGYDLQIRSETFVNNDNHDWLASAHGTAEMTESATLDSANLLATYTTGDVPAGVVVSRVTATGRWSLGYPVDGVGAATYDRSGHLLHAVTAKSGANPVGSVMMHGKVIAARVPGTAPVAARHPHIQYV